MEARWHTAAEWPDDPARRPGRVFVRVTGWAEHSNQFWTRIGIGIAHTDNSGPFGYSEADIRHIERVNDMMGSDGVTHWAPMSILPPVQP